mgnify:FL=1
MGLNLMVRHYDIFLGFMAKLWRCYFLLKFIIFFIVQVLGSISTFEQLKNNKAIKQKPNIRTILKYLTKVLCLIALPKTIIDRFVRFQLKL